MATNWADPNSKVSKYFTVRECTWLPSWSVMHVPSAAEKANIVKMAQKMDQIRDLVGKPISVHVWIRPTATNCAGPHAGQNYNATVGGAARSAHTLGLGVDWDAGENCDTTRAALEPHLESLGVRMERMPGGSWIHIDLMPPNPHRYFNP